MSASVFRCIISVTLHSNLVLWIGIKKHRSYLDGSWELGWIWARVCVRARAHTHTHTHTHTQTDTHIWKMEVHLRSPQLSQTPLSIWPWCLESPKNMSSKLSWSPGGGRAWRGVRDESLLCSERTHPAGGRWGLFWPFHILLQMCIHPFWV